MIRCNVGCARSPCAPLQEGCCTVRRVSPRQRHFRWYTWPLTRSPNPLHICILSQVLYTLIHWDFIFPTRAVGFVANLANLPLKGRSHSDLFLPSRFTNYSFEYIFPKRATNSHHNNYLFPFIVAVTSIQFSILSHNQTAKTLRAPSRYNNRYYSRALVR